MKEDVYTDVFFDKQSDNSHAAAQTVLSLVHEKHPFSSMLDLGCGVGGWVAAAMAMGKTDVLGIDGDYVNREKLLVPEDRFMAHDLSQEVRLGRRFDLVMSVEVAEHIEAEYADRFVGSLTAHSDAILFSAALPLQGGRLHVNETWAEVWQQKFADHGYEPVDFIRDQIWGMRHIPFWYRQNICFFRKIGTGDTILPDLARTNFPTRVHPELYLRVHKRVNKIGKRYKRRSIRTYQRLAES